MKEQHDSCAQVPERLENKPCTENAPKCHLLIVNAIKAFALGLTKLMDALRGNRIARALQGAPIFNQDPRTSLVSVHCLYNVSAAVPQVLLLLSSCLGPGLLLGMTILLVFSLQIQGRNDHDRPLPHGPPCCGDC